MSPAAKWLSIALVVLVTFAGIQGARRYHLADRLSPEPEDEAALAQLFAMPMKTPQGETRRLSDWRGKVLVVNFWATWCPPCLEEMPEFSLLQDEYGPNGVQFVGIAIDDAANVAKFARTTPISYPLLISSAGVSDLSARLGNRHQVLPFSLIIGRNGKQFSSHIGRLSREEFNKQVVPLL